MIPDGGILYANFGFRDGARSWEPGSYCNWEACAALKREGDPLGRFPGLYEKTVQRG